MTTHTYPMVGIGDWVDTGLDVEIGQDLRVCAEGLWSPVTVIGYTDPDGLAHNYQPVDFPTHGFGEFSGDNYFNLVDIGIGNTGPGPYPLTHTDHWSALCGYIGTPGTNEPPAPAVYLTDPGGEATAKGPNVFLLGSSFSGTAPATGRLYIRSSDDAYTATFSDNDGAIVARITVDGTDCDVPEPDCADVFVVVQSAQTHDIAIQVWRNTQLIRVFQWLPSSTARQYSVVSTSCDFDSNGNLYFSVIDTRSGDTGTNFKVIKVDATTHAFSNHFVTGAVTTGNPSCAVDVDDSDVIHSADSLSSGTILRNRRINTSGTSLSFTALGGLTSGQMRGAAIKADGSLLHYGSNSSNQVRRWNVGPGTQGTDLTVSYLPQGICVDTGSNLWVGGPSGELNAYQSVTDTLLYSYTPTAGTIRDVAQDYNTNVIAWITDTQLGKIVNNLGYVFNLVSIAGEDEDLRGKCLAVLCAGEGPDSGIVVLPLRVHVVLVPPQVVLVGRRRIPQATLIGAT